MKNLAKTYQTNAISRRPWFLALRLVIPALLIGSGLVFLRPIPFNYSLLAIYGALTFFLISYTIIARNYSEGFTRIIIIILIACELLIEGLLVNHVGGNFSPFILFFIMTIVTASLFFRLIGSIVVATLAGLLYSLPIFFSLSFIYEGLIDSTRFAGVGLSSDEAFYMVFLHLCLFYLCAFISGYLAENLFLASKELSKIRLETNEILEQMYSGMMTVDSQGRIIYFNKAAGEILGVDHIYAKGKLPRQFFQTGLAQFIDRLDSALKDGLSVSRAEINIRHPEKGIIPVGLSMSVLRGGEKEIRGVIAIFQDLTEAKKLEARMRASDRLAAVGQLAAGIAHEIRNPLASISGSVEVLKDDLKLNGDDLKLLELILKESSRLNTILTDFLNFARVSKVSTGKCDLTKVITEVASLASTHNRLGNSIAISHRFHKPVFWVSGGEDQFKQILWNLILNAAQAIGAGTGIIQIETSEIISENGNATIKLSVADNGRGIPESVKEKIFDPFFSTKDGGTGLGLPIVARIVDCLGGKIEVESSAKGTIFTIFLPPEESETKKERILEAIEVN
jgi:two-component system sensor histidine kinase PilS (NtrC family)